MYQNTSSLTTKECEFSPENIAPKTFYWNQESNSAELLKHWIDCRGHRFGYGEEVTE